MDFNNCDGMIRLIVAFLAGLIGGACRTNLGQTDLIRPAAHRPALAIPVGANANLFFCAITETQPEFPGGMKKLLTYIQHNTNYPEAARQANITGKVFVSFVLDTAGYMTDINVLKGLGYGCDDEAVRLVRAMPTPWKPGTRSGRVTAVKYNMPVFFPPKPTGQLR